MKKKFHLLVSTSLVLLLGASVVSLASCNEDNEVTKDDDGETLKRLVYVDGSMTHKFFVVGETFSSEGLKVNLNTLKDGKVIKTEDYTDFKLSIPSTYVFQESDIGESKTLIISSNDSNIMSTTIKLNVYKAAPHTISSDINKEDIEIEVPQMAVVGETVVISTKLITKDKNLVNITFNGIPAIDNKDNTFSFIMPDEDVELSANLITKTAEYITLEIDASSIMTYQVGTTFKNSNLKVNRVSHKADGTTTMEKEGYTGFKLSEDFSAAFTEEDIGQKTIKVSSAINTDYPCSFTLSVIEAFTPMGDIIQSLIMTKNYRVTSEDYVGSFVPDAFYWEGKEDHTSYGFANYGKTPFSYRLQEDTVLKDTDVYGGEDIYTRLDTTFAGSVTGKAVNNSIGYVTNDDLTYYKGLKPVEGTSRYEIPIDKACGLVAAMTGNQVPIAPAGMKVQFGDNAKLNVTVNSDETMHFEIKNIDNSTPPVVSADFDNYGKVELNNIIDFVKNDCKLPDDIQKIYKRVSDLINTNSMTIDNGKSKATVNSQYFYSTSSTEESSRALPDSIWIGENSASITEGQYTYTINSGSVVLGASLEGTLGYSVAYLPKDTKLFKTFNSEFGYNKSEKKFVFESNGGSSEYVMDYSLFNTGTATVSKDTERIEIVLNDAPADKDCSITINIYEDKEMKSKILSAKLSDFGVAKNSTLDAYLASIA